ncbi:MAG: hypothetical protein MRT15_04085 [archaeon YNP-LCB-003-016]|uniref:hypothetical protein n=1 Tax=Candidatus Culexarchaeum yellowstonense TaxID=2928963 RepID=UPI0026E989EF|nr:hypothetical protein [Candidatus Culexarchaeum yellowstonense]MCR6691547.1 hypothetical protein [Candidatus Culexarchaeum yellowstonense]
MQNHTNMGFPAPNKSPEPPRAEAGKGMDEILFGDIVKGKTPVEAYLLGMKVGYDMGWKAAASSILLTLTNRYYTGLSEETTKLIEKIITNLYLR